MIRLLLGIAILPAAWLLYQVNKLDRLEKEPGKLLVWLMIGGAGSALAASVLETIGEALIAGMQNEILQVFVLAVFVVGLAEEGCKLLLLWIISWRRKEFNCNYDGIVYAVFCSMGFAILENILYVMDGGFSTGLIRAVTAIPGHAFFGVLMGREYARAKRAQILGDKKGAVLHIFLGMGLSAFIHGLYDFFAMLNSDLSTVLFLALLVLIYIFCIRMVKKASKEDFFFVPETYGGQMQNQGYPANPRLYPSSTWTIPMPGTSMAAGTMPGAPMPADSMAQAVPSPAFWHCPCCGGRNAERKCSFCGWMLPANGDTSVPIRPIYPPLPTKSVEEYAYEAARWNEYCRCVHLANARKYQGEYPPV